MEAGMLTYGVMCVAVGALLLWQARRVRLARR
jgi:hypothetical protein